MILVAPLGADGLVAQVARPPLVAGAGVGPVDLALAVHAAGQGHAGLAVLAQPALVAPDGKGLRHHEGIDSSIVGNRGTLVGLLVAYTAICKVNELGELRKRCCAGPGNCLLSN